MKAINLMSLTLVAAAIAIPAVTYAENSHDSQSKAGVSITNDTTTEDLGISGDVDARIDSRSRSSQNRDRTEAEIDTNADIDVDTEIVAEFDNFDENNDGTITQSEFTANTTLNQAGEAFADLDLDKDGRLDPAEFDLFAQSTNDASGGVRASR